MKTTKMVFRCSMPLITQLIPRLRQTFGKLEILCRSGLKLFNQASKEGQPFGSGQGTLIPLQKLGKPLGPLNSVHSIVLLSTIRKALSLLVLSRIDPINNNLRFQIQIAVQQISSGVTRG